MTITGIMMMTCFSFLASANEQTVGIGERFGGGIVFYIFQPGEQGYVEGEQHGLIVALEDQGRGVEWSNVTTASVSGTTTGLGAGRDNTTLIISQDGHQNSAAKLCEDYVFEGYSDWYLPSSEELDKLYSNKGLVYGFSDGHLSSSESGPGDVWANLDCGVSRYHMKMIGIHVRAIRSF